MSTEYSMASRKKKTSIVKKVRPTHDFVSSDEFDIVFPV